jgi:hypothetical protein
MPNRTSAAAALGLVLSGHADPAASDATVAPCGRAWRPVLPGPTGCGPQDRKRSGRARSRTGALSGHSLVATGRAVLEADTGPAAPAR